MKKLVQTHANKLEDGMIQSYRGISYQNVLQELEGREGEAVEVYDGPMSPKNGSEYSFDDAADFLDGHLPYESQFAAEIETEKQTSYIVHMENPDQILDQQILKAPESVDIRIYEEDENLEIGIVKRKIGKYRI